MKPIAMSFRKMARDKESRGRADGEVVDKDQGLTRER